MNLFKDALSRSTTAFVDIYTVAPKEEPLEALLSNFKIMVLQTSIYLSSIGRYPNDHTTMNSTPAACPLAG